MRDARKPVPVSTQSLYLRDECVFKIDVLVGSVTKPGSNPTLSTHTLSCPMISRHNVYIPEKTPPLGKQALLSTANRTTLGGVPPKDGHHRCRFDWVQGEGLE